MGGRRVYHARGKVLGGSSSVNGMIFQRGNPLDYERWASDAGMETWDHAHCLPYFKRMENCLAAAARRSLPRPRRPARAGARAGAGTAVRRVLRRRPGGGLPAHRRRQRIPPGGVRGLRPQRPRRPAAVGRAGVPAPGDEAAQPEGRDVRAGGEDRVRGRPRGRGRVRAPGGAGARGAGGRGAALRRARSTRRSCSSSPAWARPTSCASLGIDVVHDLPGVGENLQDHLEVYVQHSAKQPVSMAPYFAMRRRPAVGLQWLLRKTGPGATNHFEAGGFVRSNDEVRVPEPDVPLPADRGALRRDAADGRWRARLPGARRADVLGRARQREGGLRRPAREAGAAVQLPVDGERPARVGRGDPGDAQDPVGSRRGRSSTEGSCRRGRRSRPTSRSWTGWPRTPRRRCTRRAPAGWERTNCRWSTR